MWPNHASPFTAPAEVKKDKAFPKCVGYSSCVAAKPKANTVQTHSWWTKSCTCCLLFLICPVIYTLKSAVKNVDGFCPSTVASTQLENTSSSGKWPSLWDQAILKKTAFLDTSGRIALLRRLFPMAQWLLLLLMNCHNPLRCFQVLGSWDSKSMDLWWSM